MGGLWQSIIAGVGCVAVVMVNCQSASPSASSSQSPTGTPSSTATASASHTASPTGTATPTPSPTPFRCLGPETHPVLPVPFGIDAAPSIGSMATSDIELVSAGSRSFCSGRGSCLRTSDGGIGGTCSCSELQTGSDCSACAGGSSFWGLACGGCDSSATLAAGYGAAPAWSLVCMRMDGSGACAPADTGNTLPLWAQAGVSSSLFPFGNAPSVLCPVGFTPCSASLTAPANASLIPALASSPYSGATRSLTSDEAAAVSDWPRSRVLPRCRPCGYGIESSSSSLVTCSGHGSCLGSSTSISGACKCDSGWTGPNCSAILPTPVPGTESTLIAASCVAGYCNGAGVCFNASDQSLLSTVLSAAAYRAGGSTQTIALINTTDMSWRCACLPGLSGSQCEHQAHVSSIGPSVTPSATPTPSMTPTPTVFFTYQPSSSSSPHPTPSASPLQWGRDTTATDAVAWSVGAWSPCSARCGSGGTSSRNITCMRFRMDPVAKSTLIWEDWPAGKLPGTPGGCAEAIALSARPSTLRTCGDWPCPLQAAPMVLDFTTGDGSDAASLALTHAQRLASDSLLRTWASNAADPPITPERITVVGYGPIPIANSVDTALLAADAVGSFAPIWEEESSSSTAWQPLGTRVLLEIAPPTSRSIIRHVALAAVAKGSSSAAVPRRLQTTSVSSAAALAALSNEPSAAAAAASISNAASDGSAQFIGPGTWLSGQGVAGWSSVMPASLGASGDTQVVLVSPAGAGLSLEWIIGLSTTGAVIVAICIGLCMGRIMFSGWWCCLRSGGQAITMAERRKLERAERGERSVVLAGKRDRRGSMQALARVHPHPQQQQQQEEEEEEAEAKDSTRASSSKKHKKHKKKSKERLHKAARRASALSALTQTPAETQKGVEQRPKLDTSGSAGSPLKANATGRASPHRRKG